MEHFLTMREALRLATSGASTSGWLFLADDSLLTLESKCVVVVDDYEAAEIAQKLGYPQEGLEMATVQSTAEWARQFEVSPSDELLLESFIYYWRFDAFLPSPGADDPPSWEETKRRLDMEFYEDLGEERKDVPCKSPRCQRGAIRNSVFCRNHHFEMVCGEPYQFDDAT